MSLSRIEFFYDLTPVQQRVIVSLGGFALLFAGFKFRAPLWFLSTAFGVGCGAGLTAYELGTKGYTQETWYSIAFLGFIFGVLASLVGTDLGLGIMAIGLVLAKIHDKIRRSEEEAKEYWLDEEERKRLEAQKGWRPSRF